MSKPENTALWNAVVETDPNFVKTFQRGGGFKGSSTNVVYLIRKATEQWGPMGGAWGVRIVAEKIIDGHVLRVMDGAVDRERLHTIQIELYYPNPLGPSGVGVVPAFGQTTIVGSNKNGFYTDEEAPKKSMTDALSKAMSWLGFAADIHLGLYDDNKYVNDRRREFGDGKDAMAGDEPPPDRHPTNGNAASGNRAPGREVGSTNGTATPPPQKQTRPVDTVWPTVKAMQAKHAALWPTVDAIKADLITAGQWSAATILTATLDQLNAAIQKLERKAGAHVKTEAKPAAEPSIEFADYAGTL